MSEWPHRLCPLPSYWRGAVDRLVPECQPCEASEGEAAPVDPWMDCTLPSYQQHGPSCVGEATANLVECLLRWHCGREVIPLGYQIDGYSIWREARRRYWNDTTDGGIYLSQGVDAARSMGLLPPDAQLVRVMPSWDSVCAALRVSPLLHGHRVTDGWMRTDRVSGCIDHSVLMDSGGLHATLLVGTQVVAPAEYQRRYAVLLNSWGASWGRYGYGVMTWDYWQRYRMVDGPYSLHAPTLATWQGWRPYLTRRGE